MSKTIDIRPINPQSIVVIHKKAGNPNCHIPKHPKSTQVCSQPVVTAKALYKNDKLCATEGNKEYKDFVKQDHGNYLQTHGTRKGNDWVENNNNHKLVNYYI